MVLGRRNRTGVRSQEIGVMGPNVDTLETEKILR